MSTCQPNSFQHKFNVTFEAALLSPGWTGLGHHAQHTLNAEGVLASSAMANVIEPYERNS